MRNIDYTQIIENIDHMINTLEYDSMRSPGKAKINADTLVSLYTLKDRYESKAVVAPTVKKQEAVVEAPVKKPVSKTTATK
jgi:hypothetical protein